MIFKSETIRINCCTMNYKLLKGGHLPDRKCREILELFCDDLTATQIADISGVSRVTVNNYFRLIRSAIASFCETDFFSPHRSLTLNTANGSGDVLCDPVNHPAYYGFNIYKGKVTTAWLKDICRESILQLQGKDDAAINGGSVPIFEGYHAIADFNDWRLYWLNGNTGISAFSNALPEITGFWKHTKSRLQKFRGMNKSTLYLHIKECEFRYNFRNDDILTVLTGIIGTQQYFKNGAYGNYATVYRNAGQS
jgi:transposase